MCLCVEKFIVRAGKHEALSLRRTLVLNTIGDL